MNAMCGALLTRLSRRLLCMRKCIVATAKRPPSKKRSGRPGGNEDLRGWAHLNGQAPEASWTAAMPRHQEPAEALRAR